MLFSGCGPPERSAGGEVTDALEDILGRDNVCISGVLVDGPTDAAQVLLQERDRYFRSLHFSCLFIFYGNIFSLASYTF